jgi:hypothetical protein
MTTKPNPALTPQDTNSAPTDPAVALAHAKKNLGESRQPSEILTESERDQTDRYRDVNGGA